MTRLLARARRIFPAIAIVGFIILTSPAYPQQGSTPIDPDASVVSEQMLLQQQRRIEGQIDQPDQRARILIQPAGRVWDHFHQITLHWAGTIIILGTIIGIAAFYFMLGKLRISAGRSGRQVPRFKAFERLNHWLTAVSFVVLAITGLNVTFGKQLLLPLIGADAFSEFSQLAKYAHNFIAFPFMIGVGVIAVIWMKDNIPDKVDVEWFKQGGGFIKSKHAPAHRFNAGEKLVFWGVLGAGAAISISGLLLLFPFYVTNIAGMQIAQVVHSVIAMLFIALILGHIYIGTIGMEGAFEAMGTGTVDFNWAKEHHDLWLKEEIAKERFPRQDASSVPAE
jgi:formate dehydrogenase subunit gamma